MANFGELPFQKFKNSIFILLLLVARCYLLYSTSLLSLLLTLLALIHTRYISFGSLISFVILSSVASEPHTLS